MSEHSGGAPELGFESQADGSIQLVRVDRWRPEDADKLEDVFLDFIQGGGTLSSFLTPIVEFERRDAACSVIRKLLVFFRTARKRALLADQLYWLSGAAEVYEGVTLGQLSKKHGISKQAFEQGAEKLRIQMMDIRSQTQRSEKARTHMSQRNVRRNKHE